MPVLDKASYRWFVSTGRKSSRTRAGFLDVPRKDRRLENQGLQSALQIFCGCHGGGTKWHKVQMGGWQRQLSKQPGIPLPFYPVVCPVVCSVGVANLLIRTLCGVLFQPPPG